MMSVLISLALFAASSVSAQEFLPSVTEGAQPWNSQAFDAQENRFMFAIHADLTGGERPRIFETAMAQLALLRPEFVISVGDLIEGGGDRDERRTIFLKQIRISRQNNAPAAIGQF